MLASKNSLIRIYRLVANIPYGGVGVRSVENILKTNRGSCSGKHKLLGEIYSDIGYEVRYCMGRCDLRSMNDYLPKSLELSEVIYDFHNFLEVRIEGEWRIVDATFGCEEGKKGLPTNVEWSGESDCNLSFSIQDEYWIVEDIFESKGAEIAGLSDAMQDKRSRYFQHFYEYLQS
ncbi:hypothetical protein A9Q99_26095 [Gammaproteobacteria bacterium 45_16_T64]|nr:hypothetical protein A9Q99_26095 [Gammaproteobacteria bacterium 45_16_T64]